MILYGFEQADLTDTNKTFELHRLPLACDPFKAKAKNKLDYYDCTCFLSIEGRQLSLRPALQDLPTS